MGVIKRRPKDFAVRARYAVPLVEASIRGETRFGAAKVPLAPNPGGIPLCRQELRQRHLPRGEPFGDAPSRYLVGSRSNRKAAGHQCGTRGRALSLDIEIQESGTLAGQCIDAWGRRTTKDAATIDPELTIAEIVGEHQDDVRFSRNRSPRRLGMFLLFRQPCTRLLRSRSQCSADKEKHPGPPVSSRKSHGSSDVNPTPLHAATGSCENA